MFYLTVLIILLGGIIHSVYFKNNNYDNLDDFDDDITDELVVLESEPYDPNQINE